MRKLVFIVGVEGSGTTMMSRILGTTSDVEVVLGNYNSLRESSALDLRELPETATAMGTVAASTKTVWDRNADFADVATAKQELIAATNILLSTEELGTTSHIVYKRSAPFFVGDRHRPDLLDIAELFADVKILVMTRDPKSSTYSAYRREFVDNLRHGAIVCEEQLLLLSAKLEVLPEEQRLVVSYERFCSEPEYCLGRVAAFCHLDAGRLKSSLAQESIKPAQNRLWQENLSAGDQDFLSNFFNVARMQQFKRLGLVE